MAGLVSVGLELAGLDSADLAFEIYHKNYVPFWAVALKGLMSYAFTQGEFYSPYIRPSVHLSELASPPGLSLTKGGLSQAQEA